MKARPAHSARAVLRSRVIPGRSWVTARRATGGKDNGAGNGVRTRDLKLGKLALYQLSYARGTVCGVSEATLEPRPVGVNPRTPRHACPMSRDRCPRISPIKCVRSS